MITISLLASTNRGIRSAEDWIDGTLSTYEQVGELTKREICSIDHLKDLDFCED